MARTKAEILGIIVATIVLVIIIFLVYLAIALLLARYNIYFLPGYTLYASDEEAKELETKEEKFLCPNPPCECDESDYERWGQRCNLNTGRWYFPDYSGLVGGGGSATTREPCYQQWYYSPTASERIGQPVISSGSVDDSEWMAHFEDYMWGECMKNPHCKGYSIQPFRWKDSTKAYMYGEMFNKAPMKKDMKWIPTYRNADKKDIASTDYIGGKFGDYGPGTRILCDPVDCNPFDPAKCPFACIGTNGISCEDVCKKIGEPCLAECKTQIGRFEKCDSSNMGADRCRDGVCKNAFPETLPLTKRFPIENEPGWDEWADILNGPMSSIPTERYGY